MKMLLLACWLATGPLQAADSDSLRVAPDFHTPPSDPGLRYSFGNYTLRDTVGPRPAGYLAVALSPGPQWYTAPTRFDAILGGAGAATSLGMFIGAVGTTLGWFDEDTSWAITGAMAAAGAIYAGTRYEPRPSLDFKWGGDSVIPGYAAPPR